MSEQAGVSIPKGEIERLKSELEQWRTWGVIEIMVRNPNVFEFVKDKEAEIDRLTRQLIRATITA